MSGKKFTRRNFLQCSGAAVASSVLACLGFNALAAHSLVEEAAGPELLDYTFGESNADGVPLLIAYATYAGSTLEIARVIGEELGRRGFRVDVKPIQGVPEIDEYTLVLIGSAVQYGAWLPEAVEFVRSQQKRLGGKRVALFSVHIQNLEDDPASTAARLAYLDTVRSFVHAEAEVFFPGRFDKRGAARLLPALIAWMMPEMDLRDWNKVRSWAESVFA